METILAAQTVFLRAGPTATDVISLSWLHWPPPARHLYQLNQCCNSGHVVTSEFAPSLTGVLPWSVSDVDPWPDSLHSHPD
ncbi:hypothetical protein RRG08_051639 [Elysia crispata]|uniref:Uncharacterized protein n=1 Tax=Elysia crispata TaxID=231223 RepID=A0AAE1A474_9GAST|nr:hypothetical protein RRG08_051639 [Elysia crispata]